MLHQEHTSSITNNNTGIDNLGQLEKYQERIKESRFLVTGGAGFIGSNIVDYLMEVGAKHVRVLDNLSTGFEKNIEAHFGQSNFEFMNGDVAVEEDCRKACEGIDIILHQAALGSIPRSIDNPLNTHLNNATGTIQLFYVAKELGINRVVYASSSSVYGDSLILPKVEGAEGNQISPYAVSKFVTEKYAFAFGEVYGLGTIGLRYFNVFGPKQNSKGPYAAAVPNFAEKVLNGESPKINGDGSQSRDFTYITNVVQVNILAAFTENSEALNKVYNVAYGESTSINDLCLEIIKNVGADIIPEYGPPRKGDIKDSLASIEKAKELLGYEPEVSLTEGLKKTMDWYKETLI